MVLEAYGRYPEPWELDDLLEFAASGAERYRKLSESNETVEAAQKATKAAEKTRATADETNDAAQQTVEQRVWADLGHALMNSAEFIYLR